VVLWIYHLPIIPEDKELWLRTTISKAELVILSNGRLIKKAV